MDNRLRPIGANTWKCLECGEIMSTGIVTLSSHWAKCAGKNFMKDLTEAHDKKELSIEKIKELKAKHK